MRRFKLAVCQMIVIDDKKKNIEKAEQMIKTASREGADLVILPEMFNCPYLNSFFPLFAESFPNGETVQMLSKVAEEEKIYLIGGSIPEKDGEDIYNTSFVFDREGKVIGKHRKIHLFDVDLDTGLSFHESNTLSSGSSLTVVDTELCRVGVAICYDMRFPELFRLYALKGADMIVVPGAFNMTTGPAHWEALLRIRAVDNQVYMVGASPARDYSAGYVAYGNSLVVEPWGNLIAKADESETIIYADIDLDRINKVRNELPLLKHLRTDLYEIRQKGLSK